MAGTSSPDLIQMDDSPAAGLENIAPPASASLLQPTTDESGVITARSRTEWNDVILTATEKKGDLAVVFFYQGNEVGDPLGLLDRQANSGFKQLCQSTSEKKTEHKVSFVKVDVNRLPGIVEVMSLDGTPCFLFIRGDGWSWKIVERVNGFSFEALEMLIEAQIAPGDSNPFASTRSLAGGAAVAGAAGTSDPFASTSSSVQPKRAPPPAPSTAVAGGAAAAGAAAGAGIAMAAADTPGENGINGANAIGEIEPSPAPVNIRGPDSEPESLQGKVALVCGSYKVRKLDRKVCKKLARSGASVVINFPNDPQGAFKVLRKVQEVGGTGVQWIADYGAPGEARRLINDVVQEFGRIDMLVVFVTVRKLKDKSVDGTNEHVVVPPLLREARQKGPDGKRTIEKWKTVAKNLCEVKNGGRLHRAHEHLLLLGALLVHVLENPNSNGASFQAVVRPVKRGLFWRLWHDPDNDQEAKHRADTEEDVVSLSMALRSYGVKTSESSFNHTLQGKADVARHIGEINTLSTPKRSASGRSMTPLASQDEQQATYA